MGIRDSTEEASSHHHRHYHHSGNPHALRHTHTHTCNGNINNTQVADEQLYFCVEQRTHIEQNM